MWVGGGTGVPVAGNTPQGPAGSSPFNANNQIGGAAYDAAGDQIFVNGNTITYDYQHRVSTVTEPAAFGGATIGYEYDYAGHRVQASDGIYVYDAFGNLAAEYSLNSAQQKPACVTCYYTTDHLGSTRVITDQNATVAGLHDYLPFGEEITNAAGRTSSLWGAADVKQKFTGKERDIESSLDYFGARYYGSALGRFTSPDWSAKPISLPYARLEDPQTLDLYAYVRNNPLSKVDVDGHQDGPPEEEEEERPEVREQELQEMREIGEQVSTRERAAARLELSNDLGADKLKALDNEVADQAEALLPPEVKAQLEQAKADAKKATDAEFGASDMKELSKSEIKNLEKNTGEDVHKIKEDIVGKKQSGKYDLFKTKDGKIVMRAKRDKSEPQPTGYTVRQLRRVLE
jgi:RHS repeat-associated protein